jgi:glycosyltransferase involved in cell wall biosynthesis
MVIQARSGSGVPWHQVSVVIPTLNEARNLPHVLGRLPSDVREVIVVDGHSVDDTPTVARRLRPDVHIVTQTRSGKGNALACGFAAATGDIIVMLDADGSADPGEIPKFVKALTDGADFAKGTRFAEGGGSSDITRLRGIGNRALTEFVNFFYSANHSDLCYGYNAFWKRHVPVLGLDATSPPAATGDGRRWGDGFEVEALIHIRVARAGLMVAEVPSFEYTRMHGVSHLSTFSDGLRVLRTVLVEHRRTRPWRPGWEDAAAIYRGGSATIEFQPDPVLVGHANGQSGQRQNELTTGRATLTATPTGRTRLPTVSVVIAAWSMNRWDDLLAAVASAGEQTISVLETVVVVDHHPGLLARAREGIPGVIVIPNTGMQGASGARNSGVAASRGEVVAFLDDDAIASPSWLESLLGHLVSPGVIGVGGRVDPVWVGQRPRWFPREFDWTVGGSYLGMPGTAESVRNVWGGNMAIWRHVFDAVGGFREGFGKVGVQACPEDTDLCLRVATVVRGGTWIYEPTGVVGHRVPVQRATFSYFCARCFNEGQGKAELAALYGVGESTSAERRYARQVLSTGIARGLREAVHGDVAGVSRSLAIAFGLLLAMVGFVVGRSATLLRPRRAFGELSGPDSERLIT